MRKLYTLLLSLAVSASLYANPFPPPTKCPSLMTLKQAAPMLDTVVEDTTYTVMSFRLLTAEGAVWRLYVGLIKAKGNKDAIQKAQTLIQQAYGSSMIPKNMDGSYICDYEVPGSHAFALTQENFPPH